MKKLLLVGSNSIHTYNYLNLIVGFFSNILFITDNAPEKPNDFDFVLTDFSIRNPINAHKSINFIKKRIAEFKPDIIHIHQAGTNAYLALKASKKFKIPTIVTAWGGDILDVPDYNFLYKKLTKYVLKNAGYFTSDSLFMASKMQHLAFPNTLDITIANFGINIEKLDLPKENLIFSNRLHKKMYRIDEIIKSFKRFITNKKHENWKLVIAGEGDETSKLKQLATELEIDDKVEFVGWLDKTYNNEYYFRSKIFVSIPTSDATSISLLEALAAGCIPVLSNLPANLEWVVDGLNGVIVDNLNNNFIEQALELDYNKVKDINSYIIEKKATKEVNRKKFIELYNRVLKSI